MRGRRSIYGRIASPNVGLAALTALALLSGCGAVQRSASALLGGPNAPWRGKDLVGAERGISLTDAQIDRRLRFLDRCLHEDQRHAFWWQYGWLAINGGGGVSSAVQASFDRGNDRTFDIIEAGKSTLGVTYLFLSPMPGWRGAAAIRTMPRRTRTERLKQLRRAEETLREAAEHARRRKSWLVHLGNIGLNLASGAVMLALGSPRLAALAAGLDSAVGEVQIWTRPWAPEEQWKEYERLVATGDSRTAAASRIRWHIAPAPGGAALRIEF